MVDIANQQSFPRETSDRMPTAQRGKRPAAGTLWEKVPGKHIFENEMQMNRRLLWPSRIEKSPRIMLSNIEKSLLTRNHSGAAVEQLLTLLSR